MKLFFLFVLLSVHIWAYEQKTKIGVTGIAHSCYADEAAVNANSTITLKNDYWKTDAGIEFFYSNRYKQRRYLLLNELYISKDIGDYSVSVGKRVKYWGELEGFNITDVYNQKNYLKDPFDKSAKYGAWGGEITRYFDENAIEVGLKIYEQNIKLPTGDTPYAAFSFDYDKELRLSRKRFTPTYYIKANLLNDTYIDSETSFVFLHGYDNKRDFVPVSQTTIAQYAYRVNKALLLLHAMYDDTIFKTELAYTDVLQEERMSDYTQLGFGLEHTFYAVVGNADMTLFWEYYRYLYSDEKKVKNVDISKVYDNDLFLAMRISFNDVKSSELKVGFLEDLKKEERVVQAKFTARIDDGYIIEGECLYTKSSDSQTILSRFGDFARFMFSFYYTF